MSEKEEAGQILQQETISIFVIRDAQAAPKDIGIILEGQEVVNKLASVANAVAILLGFLYALNQEYPKTLKLIFDYIQKVFMELDPEGMTTKVKKLYDQLHNRAWFRFPTRPSFPVIENYKNNKESQKTYVTVLENEAVECLCQPVAVYIQVCLIFRYYCY